MHKLNLSLSKRKKLIFIEKYSYSFKKYINNTLNKIYIKSVSYYINAITINIDYFIFLKMYFKILIELFVMFYNNMNNSYLKNEANLFL